jgi:hypothetical protein
MLVTGIIITYLRCDESLGLDELYTVDPPQNLEKSLRELYQILPLDREKHYVCWLRKKTRTRRTVGIFRTNGYRDTTSSQALNAPRASCWFSEAGSDLRLIRIYLLKPGL